MTKRGPRPSLRTRLRWDTAGYDEAVSGDPATMARAFAYLYGLGATLVFVTLLFPGAPDRWTPGVAGPAVVAALTALFILWRFERLSRRAFLALPPLGTVLITVIVFSGGGTVVAVYAMFYFWPVLTAFSFQGRSAGIANVTFVAIAYGAGLVLVEGTSEVMLRWLMAMGTLAVAGLLIGALRARVERLVSELRHHGEQQDVVAEVGQRALAGAPIDQLSQWAANAVAANLRAEHAAVFMLIPDERRLLVRAGVGWNRKLERTTTVAVDSEPLLARALVSDEPEFAVDRTSGTGDERRELDPHRHGAPATGCRRLPPTGAGATGLAVAIQGHHEPAGVLAAYSCSGRIFSERDASFIKSVANVLADAIRRRDAEDMMRRQALLDPLTGRPNRTLFMDRLSEALLRAGESDSRIAVFEVDIDEFRLINDASGHEIGDALLRSFAPRLREALVLTDTVARVGGDEFAILCEGAGDEARTAEIAEAIRDAVSAPFEIGSEQYRLTASIGVALSGRESPGADVLMARASAAARVAKSRGHGRIEFFDETQQKLLRSRRSLYQELREAAKRDELQLVVQPIRYLTGGPVRSTEVLLRWEHPQLGTVSPAEFIPLAEETGIVAEIGEWVLARSCELAAAWRADDYARQFLPLNVNISPKQLARADFSDCVAEALAFAGASPKDIGLEITEHALVHDQEASSWSLAALREMGVYTLLDDFGTGFSSLNHLKQLPIDAVKIDGSFVAGLLDDQGDAAIVAATCAMASAFSIEVVAEGVEKLSQVEALRGLGCILGQGYYFDRPMAPEKLASAATSSLQDPSSLT